MTADRVVQQALEQSTKIEARIAQLRAAAQRSLIGVDEIPPGARRLFAHPEEIDSRKHQPYVIGRLLEEGDSADLRALTSSLSEGDLEEWVRRRGGRQLSSRSRAFWSLVLGIPEPELPRSELVEALWPL